MIHVEGLYCIQLHNSLILLFIIFDVFVIIVMVVIIWYNKIYCELDDFFLFNNFFTSEIRNPRRSISLASL